MADTGSARGGLGWVILVVALAVPGVLFYNWWSNLKAEREKTVAAKARGRVPDGGMFQSSPNVKLVNPMTPAVSTETAASPAMVAAATDAVHAAPVVAAPAQVQPPAVSSETATVPPLKRDPTLSPFDQVRIIAEDEAKRKAADDLANMQRPKQAKKIKALDPKSLVELQGIVSNFESGFKAIVNNQVVATGQFIGNTRIKVVKISDLGVTFEYQGKRFSKGVGRD